MDRDKVVERVSKTVYRKLCERSYAKHSPWEELSRGEKAKYYADVEIVLEAAGYFEIKKAGGAK